LNEEDNRIVSRAFRPRTRLLELLGDQLIGSPRLSLFELVKDAYDADADQVAIREQLLMIILAHSAIHAIRPATMRF